MINEILPPSSSTRERFATSFAVTAYESDFTGRFTLFALFNRFQELAGRHAAYLGVGFDAKHGSTLLWFLSRIKLQIRALPKWGDAVTLTTWPKGIDKLFALRDFMLTDDRGETLALGTSAWLVFDAEKNRPQRIDRLPVDLLFPDAPHAIAEIPDKLQPPEALAPAGQRAVALSELDANEHVNNAQYVKWITDCFPPEQYRRRRISSVQINYLEAAKFGDAIEFLKSTADETAKEYFIIGKNAGTAAAAFHACVGWE